MDKNMLRRAIYEYIQTSYTGGYGSFLNDGGDFMVDPVIDDQILIYHPNFPQKLKEDLLNRSQLTFKFLNSINFKDQDDKEIEENIWNVKVKIIRQYDLQNIAHEEHNKIALLISIKDEGLNDETIELIANQLLSSIPKLIRGFIYHNNEIYPFGNFDTSGKPTAIPSCILAHKNTEQRNTVIKEDDVTNLIITLNQSDNFDVLDVIEKL